MNLVIKQKRVTDVENKHGYRGGVEGRRGNKLEDWD